MQIVYRIETRDGASGTATVAAIATPQAARRGLEDSGGRRGRSPGCLARVRLPYGRSRRDRVASANYRLFERAMRMRKPVYCQYGGYQRELCPVILGPFPR